MNTDHLFSRWARALVLIVLVAAVARTASAQPAFLTNALDFNRIYSAHVTVPAAAGAELNSAFTVEAWVNVRNHASWARLLDFGNGQANNNVVCALTEGITGYPIMDTYNGGTRIGRVQSSTALPLNAWTHLAFTCDGTVGRIFINGSQVASNLAGTYSGPRTNNYIGRSNWPDDYADALMAEYRIWNVARSEAQIQGATNIALAGNETGLRLYYRFDGFGTTVPNHATAAGSAYDGTLVNGPARVHYGPPQVITLKTLREGNNVIFHWDATDPVFFLQYKDDLSFPIWRTTNNAVLVAGEYRSTNAISDQSRFFRLLEVSNAPCSGPMLPPTLGPVPSMGLTGTRFILFNGLNLTQPANALANMGDGAAANILSAAGFVDPASCGTNTLSYHWVIDIETSDGAISETEYAAQGVTGYLRQVLHALANSIPESTATLHLTVTSSVSGLSTTMDIKVAIGTDALTPAQFARCRLCPLVGECPDCFIAAARPTTEPH